jgi:hypothetical protein
MTIIFLGRLGISLYSYLAMSSLSKLRQAIRELTLLLRDIAQLVLAIRLLLLAAAAAAVILLNHPGPPPKPPVRPCAPGALTSTLVREVDRRFYRNHPEIPPTHRIRPHEGTLAQEWWAICDQVLQQGSPPQSAHTAAKRRPAAIKPQSKPSQ